MSRDPGAALAAARAVLEEAGLAHAGLSAAGPEHEVLGVAADPAVLPRLRGLAPSLKQAGFRYVALELERPAPARRASTHEP